MKKKKNTEELFETVRALPTELTSSQVEAIIVQLPLLPPPPGNNWLQWFNLNNIIMSTIGTVVLISAALFFAQQEAPIPKEELSLEKVIVPPATSIEIEAPESLDSQKIANENMAIDRPVPMSEAEKVFTAEDVSEELVIIEAEVEPKPSINNIKPSTDLVILDTAEPLIYVEPKPQVFGDCESKVEIKSADIKRLKRELTRKLLQDRLVGSSRENIKVSIPGNRIRVNDTDIGDGLFRKYTAIIQSYGIKPCNRRHILMSPDFIMVGQITSKGFSGTAHGKMDLEDIARDFGFKYSRTSIVPSRADGYADRLFAEEASARSTEPLFAASVSEPEDVLIGTATDAVAEEPLLSDAVVETADESLFGVAATAEAETAVSVVAEEVVGYAVEEPVADAYAEEPPTDEVGATISVAEERVVGYAMDEPLADAYAEELVPEERGVLKGSLTHTLAPHLSKGQALALDEKLMQALKDDRFISPFADEISLKVEEDAIFVGNTRLRSPYYQQYKRRLQRYGIYGGPDRYIKLSPNLIMVGDFIEGGFKGSMYEK